MKERSKQGRKKGNKERNQEENNESRKERRKATMKEGRSLVGRKMPYAIVLLNWFTTWKD